jgi:hypothetical protein
LLLNAAAFTVALFDSVNAPEYRVDDAVGVVPSVVYRIDAPAVADAIVTDVEPVKLPPLGLIVGVATVGRVTTRLNVVVLVTPPPTADTVIVEVPAGVVPAVVLIVNVEEQVGLQLADVKDVLAPAGNPAVENVTAWAVPDRRVALIR